MKLYQNPMSPPCRRALAAAHHLNMPFEPISVDFKSGQLEKPEYKKMNPNGAVPLLDDNGFYLWESTAIMQYMAEKKGDTEFYPKDLQKRADINRWTSWAQCHFNPATSTIVWENFMKPMFGMGQPDQKAIDEAAEDFHKYAKVLDAQLATHKFITGTAVTIADFTIGSAMMYAVQGKVPLSNYPNISAWYQRLEAVDAWKITTPKM